MRARRAVGHALAIVLLAAPALVAGGNDPTRSLAGTWGLPPDDANPYASGFGSYFFLVPDGSGQTQAQVSLYASGWDCRLDGPVTWNAERARFEWPNRSSGANEKVCWFSAEPLGERLKVAIRCSYQCTDPDNTHEQVLDRIAATRLEPPPGVTEMFCASHDALRQALCHRGPLHESVGQARQAAERLRVLGRGAAETATDSDDWSANTKKALLRILAACHASGSEAACLKARVDDETRRMEAKVGETQRALAEERARSRAAETRIERNSDRLAWQGTWYQDNDELFTTLTIEQCAAEGCELSFSAETNYAFGCTGDSDSGFQCRTGSCWLENAAFRFNGVSTAYGYVEPHSDDQNEAGAGPFANYCRFDLERGEGRVRLDLTGIGCRSLCTNAPVEPLRGEYQLTEKPSFECGKDPSELAVDERTICLDAELAALDRDLAGAFAKAKAALKGGARDALLVSQRSFLKQRRGCEAGEGHRQCLMAAYQGRLKEIAALLGP